MLLVLLSNEHRRSEENTNKITGANVAHALETIMTSQNTPPETRLWQAVIATTIQEWVSGPLSAQREAERYIFSPKSDFRLVCESAGMNPDYLRGRLERMRKQTPIANRRVVHMQIRCEETEMATDLEVV